MMSYQMIKTIIFDIGGVLTFTDFGIIYMEFAKRAGLSPQFVIDYHQRQMNELLLGTTSLGQFFAEMGVKSGKSEEDLRKIWLEVGLPHRKINQELIDILPILQKKYSVGTLTNLSPHRKIMDEAINLYQYFDYKVLSCDLGLKKPDPRFYTLALKYAKAEPGEAIFIDDDTRYINAASGLGMNVIQFISTKQIKADLDKMLKEQNGKK